MSLFVYFNGVSVPFLEWEWGQCPCPRNIASPSLPLKEAALLLLVLFYRNFL